MFVLLHKFHMLRNVDGSAVWFVPAQLVPNCESSQTEFWLLES